MQSNAYNPKFEKRTLGNDIQNITAWANSMWQLDFGVLKIVSRTIW